MGKMPFLLRWAIPLLVLLPALPLFLVSCAKRPVTIAAAPAPTAPVASAAPAPPGPASGAPSPQVVAPTPRGGAQVVTQRPPVPAPVQPPAPKEFAAIKDLKPIHFDFDRDNLRPGDAKILEENARWMKANENYLILIEGHADERGTNEYNLALGERRAKSTMNYLVTLGVQARRITTISYGEERPICTEKNEECWAKDRRAHFLVKAQ